MTISNAFQLSLIFLSISLLIQSFELYSICSNKNLFAPWSWNNIKTDFSNWNSKIEILLSYLYASHFKKLVIAQMILSLFLLIIPKISIILLIITYLLIALRFRGVFNGGSDYMTMTTLIALSFAQFTNSHDSLSHIGLYYLAIHCTLSYFIAGFIKIKNATWRNGFALQTFLLYSNYPVLNVFKTLSKNNLFNVFGSILVIFFECSFPLVWLFPSLTFYYLLSGLLFHLIMFLTFGLNRFVFAWLASYPALAFCTLR